MIVVWVPVGTVAGMRRSAQWPAFFDPVIRQARFDGADGDPANHPDEDDFDEARDKAFLKRP